MCHLDNMQMNSTPNYAQLRIVLKYTHIYTIVGKDIIDEFVFQAEKVICLDIPKDQGKYNL